MPSAVNIEEFLKLAAKHPVIDVRTPAEYNQGHIPNAINIPLFSNEERAIVGTIYKQQGRNHAIHKGLEFVGPRMNDIIHEVKKIENENIFLIHCWRGGMRSSSVAWLLELYGLKVYSLKGGYKYFRKYIAEVFTAPKKIVVLGGKTGSGKTYILKLLKEKGEQVIDLENIARHKGSSFGKLGEPLPPSQEQFENLLAWELSMIDPEKICWIEDESRLIGNKVIPFALWEQIRNARVYYIDIPLAERVSFLVKEYGNYSIDELKQATERIKKRLGGQHVKAALQALDEGDLKTACEINLAYYDKAYSFGLEKRKKSAIEIKTFEKIEIEKIANAIIKWK